MLRVSLATLVTVCHWSLDPMVTTHQVTGCSHLGSQVGTDSDSDTLCLTPHGTPAPVALAASPGLACHCCLAQPRTHHTMASSCHITHIIGQKPFHHTPIVLLMMSRVPEGVSVASPCCLSVRSGPSEVDISSSQSPGVRRV